MEVMKREGLKKSVLLGMVLLFFLFSVACSKPTLYRWNEYEAVTHDMFINPGKADTGTQIVKLTEEIEKTHANGQRVPPGLHIHLGYMYFLKGNIGAAHQEFEIEKQLFPESKKFIDGILERMKK